jgi:transcriptional regulator with XRE-family HTH domain
VRRRERLGLTQEAFADSVGLHTPYYGQIERGRQNVTLWNLQRVAAGLDVSVASLLKSAEGLDLAKASKTPHRPPRVGRPPGRRSGH